MNTPNNEDLINEFVNGIGAIAETCGVFRVELMKQGFTKEESLTLVGKLIEGIFSGIYSKGNNR